jgi:hypothetical protein
MIDVAKARSDQLKAAYFSDMKDISQIHEDLQAINEDVPLRRSTRGKKTE